LDEDQLANAIAISMITHGPPLGIVDAEDLPYTHVKNIMGPTLQSGGILGALLAQKGFTGNREGLFEHPLGIHLVARGFTDQPLDIKQLYSADSLKDPSFPDGVRWQILRDRQKYFGGAGGIQAMLLAHMSVITDNDIRPEDVKAITVWTYGELYNHLFDPTKRFPENKETADHSAPFMLAVATIDRALGPDQYTPAKIKDPRVHALIRKVKAEKLPELRAKGEAIVEIETTEGKKFRARSDHRRPMPDEFLEEKFRMCCSGLMTENQVDETLKTCYHLNELDDIGDLMGLLVF
jgi:2-methylcitrate dehydratase